MENVRKGPTDEKKLRDEKPRVLSDVEVNWVKERVDSGIEDTLHGVTNSEILWGGPRGEGLVYVVNRLVEATGSLASTVTELKAAEDRRIEHAQRISKAWGRARILFFYVITPATLLTFLKSAYLTLTPILNSHGAHLPYLESGAKLEH